MDNSNKNMLTVNLSQMSELCKVCLISHKNVNVFELCYDDKLLSEIFTICTNIQIDEGITDFPNSLCEGCVADMMLTYHFLKKCRNTDEIIKNLISASREETSDELNLPSNIFNSDCDSVTFEEETEFKLEETDTVLYNAEETVFESEIKISFVCELCGEGFIFQTSLEKHIELAHKSEEPSTCHNCGKKFINLVQHTKVCEEITKEFVPKKSSYIKPHKKSKEPKNTEPQVHLCSVCGKCFGQRCILKKHLGIHETSTKNKCDVCGKGFKQPSYLKTHKRIHSHVFPFTCKFCRKKFKSRKLYERHLCPNKILSRLRNPTENIQDDQDGDSCVCKVCKKHFENMEAVTVHMKECHQIEDIKEVESSVKEDLIPCTLCNEKFLSKYTLSLHKVEQHRIRHIQCKICDQYFGTKSNFTVHMRKHSGEVVATCKYCKKGFHVKSIYREHLAIHEPPGDPVECEICHKFLRSEQALKRHLSGHINTFVCVECGKGFNNKSKLREHSYYHRGIKRFKCDYCPLAFYAKSQLTKHEKTHQKNRKPTPCQFCDKSYLSAHRFREHVRKYHLKELEDKILLNQNGMET